MNWEVLRAYAEHRGATYNQASNETEIGKLFCLMQSRGVIKDEYIELNYRIMRGFPGDLTSGVVRPREPILHNETLYS